MPPSVPHLDLSHGQVLWCLAGGREAVPPLPDQVRYLRQRGIPFAPSELGQGRGVRLSYGFYHFIEVGIAYEGLRLRIPPRYLAVLVDDRVRYRNLYREAYRQLAENPALLEAPAGRSRAMFGEEFYLRLHDRYSDTPGQITPVFEAGSSTARKFGDWVEQYEGQPDRDVIPLKARMVDLLRLAPAAPQTKPGPKG